MGATNPGLNIFANQPPLDLKTTGRVFWVGNATTAFVPGGVTGVDSAGAYGDSPQRPFATIDYAVGFCTADRGDTIVALPGHIEPVTAAGGLDLDVAGITVLFLGDGATRGTIRFGAAAGAVGSDMDIDAANITLGAKGKDLGPRFLANLDALTGPIDVNQPRFKMYGAKWHDGTTINTTDCVVADASADNMEIDDFEFVDGDGAGTQKQSFIQIAAATGVILKNIKGTGDFGTGIIENGTAWVDALLEDLVLDNANASPTVCLLLQPTSSGWARNCSLRVASGTTGYTAANDMQFDNVKVVGTDASAAGDAVIGQAADAAATGAVTATDTLMAYIKHLVTMLGPTELDTDTLGEILVGSAGITSYPAAEAPGNTVPLAAAIRAIYNAISADGTASATTVQTGIGRRVTKVGDVASAPDDLFTVTGKCLITLMVGEVTSVLATTTSILLMTSTNSVTIANTTDVLNDVLGTLYLVTGDPDDTLNGDVTTIPNVDVAWSQTGFHAPFMVNDDRIYMSVGGAGTGTIQWDLWYIPLEDSASIASSA